MNPERRNRIRHVSAQRQLDLAVVLENVHDTHNIGAVLRSCDSVGIQSVYVVYTDPALSPSRFKLGKRTSGGARKWVDVYVYRDVEECVAEVRKRYGRLLALTVGKQSSDLYNIDFTEPAAIVFGNEHEGISDDLARVCDGHVYIPQMGMARSLNISVACAVTLYEILRQRKEQGMYEKNMSAPSVEFDDLYMEFVDRHESGYIGRRPREIK